MDLLTPEERESLTMEYDHLHDEMWRRSQNTWLVQTILITGSLLITFPNHDLTSSSVSLMLILVSLILHLTDAKVTHLCHLRLHEIEKKLGIVAPLRRYKAEVEGRWWFVIRKNMWYGLYTILIGVYLFFIFHCVFFLAIMPILGFVAVLVNELYAHLKREIEKSVKKKNTE